MARRRRISSDVSVCYCNVSPRALSLYKSHVFDSLCTVRKNSVIRGYTTFNSNDNSSALPKIRLVDVMPKESERQRQLQQQQEDLEREQELADQLFNDAPAKSGRKRKGGGSMDQYLTQKSTTTKAKRGRGRR